MIYTEGIALFIASLYFLRSLHLLCIRCRWDGSSAVQWPCLEYGFILLICTSNVARISRPNQPNRNFSQSVTFKLFLLGQSNRYRLVSIFFFLLFYFFVFGFSGFCSICQPYTRVYLCIFHSVDHTCAYHSHINRRNTPDAEWTTIDQSSFNWLLNFSQFNYYVRFDFRGKIGIRKQRTNFCFFFFNFG